MNRRTFLQAVAGAATIALIQPAQALVVPSKEIVGPELDLEGGLLRIPRAAGFGWEVEFRSLVDPSEYDIPGYRFYEDHVIINSSFWGPMRTRPTLEMCESIRGRTVALVLTRHDGLNLSIPSARLYACEVSSRDPNAPVIEHSNNGVARMWAQPDWLRACPWELVVRFDVKTPQALKWGV